ncbi:MAG: hypothetical protein ACFFDU_05700 [Candidatus Thorarchaeota archaeon]
MIPTITNYEKERISSDSLPTAKPEQRGLKWLARHWKKFVITGLVIFALWIIWLLFFSGVSWEWIPESEYTGPGLSGIITITFAITWGFFLGLGMSGRRIAKKELIQT